MTDLLPIETPVDLPLPDPRPSDPLEALSWLGETEEEVVKALRERRLTGTPMESTSCVIANYLHNWFPFVSSGATFGCIGQSEEDYRAVDYPAHITDLIGSFDSGLYPDLIADD